LDGAIEEEFEKDDIVQIIGFEGNPEEWAKQTATLHRPEKQWKKWQETGSTLRLSIYRI
jgi:hypothetical protein